MITKQIFCAALRMLKEQEAIDDEFGKALQMVGNGYFVFGTEKSADRPC